MRHKGKRLLQLHPPCSLEALCCSCIFVCWSKTSQGQFSFQSQRKAMPKNVRTTAQLHSSHTLGKCSKFSKPGLNSMWTMNFQMFKLDLEKIEEPEIKLPTSIASSKNIYFCFIDYAKAFDCVDHNKLWKLLEMGIPDHLTCLLRNLYVC